MPKQLKDILNGVKKSKVAPEKLGDRPHVDYEPKAPAEQDWVAKHSVEKHEDRVGNGDDVYQATNVKKVSNKKTNKGHDKGEDEKVYEAKEAEEAKCNNTPKGTSCPVHGMTECMSAKKINELGPSTLSSYTKKATGDIAGRAMSLGLKSANPFSSSKSKEAEHKKLSNRFLGVNRASDKLARMAKEEVEEVELDEVLTKKTSVGEIIKDFQQSTNPKFAGKSKEKRKEMALAAYYAKQRNEDLAMPLLGGDVSDLPKGRSDDTQEEIEMVKAELKALANKALHILMAMPQNLHVEPWVQAKIAQAKEMINSVHDYMVYGDHDKEEAEQTDTPMTFPGMNVDNALGMNV